MRLVLDTALTMNWCFDSGDDDYSQGVLAALAEGEALVAPDWPLTVAAFLRRALVQALLTEEDAREFLALLEGLPIRMRVAPLSPTRALELLVELGLSPAQIACLHLAQRERLPLATQDERLRRAAGELGVALFEPGP